jgi:Ca-activated chloride channel family protein
MKTSSLGLRALLIIILASTGPVHAQTPGSLFLGEDRAPALSLAMDTRIEVSGLVARVAISQTFLYRGLEPVEGLYEFPLPTGAAVDTLRVTLDDRVIVGEIHERETARRRYEQARNQGRRAALVEQHKANLFATNVANIEPGVPVTVEIAYQQPVVFREGQFELRVPFVVTPRYTPAGEVLDLLSPPDEDCECGYAPETTAIDVKLNGAWRISDISSPSHKLQIETEPDAFRVSLAPDTPLNGDFVLRWTPLVERQVATSVYTESFAGEDYALVLFVPSLQPRPAVPREVIFVIDTSGSMAEDDRMSFVKQGMNLLIDELGYLTLKPEQVNAFFKLMDLRYATKPSIITTNLDYPDWYELFQRKPLVDALLDRLQHHCITIRIDGPSLRVPDSDPNPPSPKRRRKTSTTKK